MLKLIQKSHFLNATSSSLSLIFITKSSLCFKLINALILKNGNMKKNALFINWLKKCKILFSFL